jgi:hypothetical protein
MLQYFNTTWEELAHKMPEIAEAGYSALWLPPPTKGSGALSVGYDLWDPFDIGGKDQRGTVRTRYGTEAELLRLIETAHRFGIRVYVDNIMNHRAFDVPGFDEHTPIDIYPGTVPEDFHLRVTEEGFYRKWDNIANWGDTWQIQYRNFSDLIDIAQESPDNGNFGTSEGDHVPKIKFVRHPNNPELYCFYPGESGAEYVGFGSSQITTALLTNSANAWLYEEDVNSYLIRAARWLVDYSKIDGLRLDAVKHVPDYFFGLQSGEDKDSSGAGYLGQAQEQFNITRGFSDWDNHRDSVFNTSQSRDDLMMFGEHLGEPPGFDGYINAGMRLVDSQLHGFLNGNLGESWGNLDGLQYAGGQGFSAGSGVMYTKSHDDDYATRPELQYGLTLTREGLPNIYTDGNYQAETLGESGGAFPRHSNTAFLGQWGDNRVPNLVQIHNHFARGYQTPRWGDSDVVAYDRIDKRENGSMDDANGAVLFFVMNDDYSSGQYREIPTSFPSGAKLWQYSSSAGGWYYTVEPDYSGYGNGMIKVIVPPGGYFAFSWRSPEESDLWSGNGGEPITIQENGKKTGWIAYDRQDGPDGDPGFNPYGVADDDPTDFTYTYYVPRVTSATNLRFAVRVDGSAKNVLMKLDGGMDLNGVNHSGGDPRDNPPAIATDLFLGYEQIDFVHRQYREKFAARDTPIHNVIGSDGAETYTCTIGSSGFSVNDGLTGRDSDDNTADWLFHDPEEENDQSEDQFWPFPENAAGSNIHVWAKMGYASDINRMYLYYTTDGETFPEGAGGEGRENTKVVEMTFGHSDNTNSSIDWWTCVIPAQPDGTPLRYKIGGFKQQNGSNVAWNVLFPSDDYNIGNKKSMMSVWELDGFDASAVEYRPHVDYSLVSTGLVEGFHVARARAFLERDDKASIYNTFVQTFYYDVETPGGEIKYPAENDWLTGNEYGVVVRTDPTVSDVWFHIEDADPANDDAMTGRELGNGTNELGQWSWIQASEVSPGLQIFSPYPDEWRFNYSNIAPGASNATIYVRLAELSSSTNPLLSDVEGHFTTLERNVIANGPDYRMFVAWPQNDGDHVSLGYDLKVLFSKNLADGVSPDDLVDRFLITIDGNAQGRDNYSVTWNQDDNHHALVYSLPDLYNGDPNYQHEIEITHTNAGGGGVTLEATRMVIADETDAGPYVDIVYPPEFDSDGKPFEIVLPDVGNPDPEDRQITIRVETDLDAQHVWIVFTNNSVGQTIAYPSTTNALAGRVAVTTGTNAVIGQELAINGTVSAVFSNRAVSGSGTDFEGDLTANQVIRIETNLMVVTQIVSSTDLYVNVPYPGTSVTGVAAFQQSAFDSELSAGDRLLIDSSFLNVSSIESSSNFFTMGNYPGTTASGLQAYRIDGNPSVNGSVQTWQFFWTNMTAGYFTFMAMVDTDGNTSTVEAYAIRNITVILREMVESDESDLDDDDDGIYDSDENTPVDLPDSNAETWLNGDVHAWKIFGRTAPLLPDTDGDGLPDGLESGWRVPIDPSQTDTNVDTNGDGWPNFLADYDPPFYNTVPDNWNLPEYVFNDPRTKLIQGTMTDASRADTDYDGIPDGVEDANRNGWADGDGEPLPPTWDPWAERDWPDSEWDAAWAVYPGRETDPNVADTDEDGASDGYGEDKNFNGWIDGDSNSNRTHETGELWQETDPLNPDTDGDGLPDGWEAQYSLDPFDNGILGHTNLSTGAVIASLEHGASGNPDGDTIILGNVTNEYTNLMELQNGTNPRYANTGEPPPEGTIVVGPGPALGSIHGVTNYQEFMDWSWNDCLVVDEYEGAGQNNQGGDVYLGWDGWDGSRDIVAFYAHDGGDTGNGGDGKFYFRVDFYDLKSHAEEGNLDLYVVIDTGNPDEGEMNLPDDVDTITWNRWEAVIAVYQSSQGRVYVDLVRDSGNNTTTWGQELTSYGVEVRGQGNPNGFIDAYFNAELDSVEFCVSRQALIDAGWSGSGASNFNYQVFTTKDGTGNSPVGDGDIGGRSDVRDAIYNDFIAEDYWQSQDGLESILKYWIPGSSKSGRAKVSVIVHGNQAIRPGNRMQELINTGSGAGYYRPLETHELFGKPLNLHVTPTLASAIEWARVDPAAGKSWLDGPSLNDHIGRLAATNIVDLMGSTFSGHIIPYFTEEFNSDNETLAREFIWDIYGVNIDHENAVFWTPERVLDSDVFGKILDIGYGYTVLDQNTHLFNWFGRTESLIDGGYRINDIGGVKCFVINDIATSYLFANHDSGLDMALRSLLIRKALSGTQDQVVVLFSNWETFTDNDDADAYDANIRWLANRPWTPIVTLQQIASDEIDVTGDDAGDTWGAVWRDPGDAASKQSHNWVNHATDEDYDNWYVGSVLEESLEDKFFEIRPGTPVSKRYGMMYSAGTIADTWSKVSALANDDVASLARAVMHASVFQTAFHDESEHDLSRYSTGDYMYPASGSNTLATLAKYAQSQTRVAAIYEEVDDWKTAAASITTTQVQQQDVDLDGENEYLLFNDRLFAVFETAGGRMIGAWVRDILTGDVFQSMGNAVSYSGSETEHEGSYNVEADGTVVSHRTSGLKDWYAEFTPSLGTPQYVNQSYSFTSVSNGWQVSSEPFGYVHKTVTLAPGSWQFEVLYELSGDLSGKTLYVRNGLSPNLYDLLTGGQSTLGEEALDAGVVMLANTNYSTTVYAYIGYGDMGHSASLNTNALDDDPGQGVEFDTLTMRNQAQTHQVELSGTGSFTFSLGFHADASDWDGDGMPNNWEDGFGFLDPLDDSDGDLDEDEDGVSNTDEYTSNTGPGDDTDFLSITSLQSQVTGFLVTFPAKAEREYHVWYDDDGIDQPQWSNATPNAITVESDQTVEWLDDGTMTFPHPSTVTNRLYKVTVSVPE